MTDNLRDLSPGSSFWQHLANLLPPNPTIVDLGAHRLEEAGILLPKLRNATWWAVEADPKMSEFCQNQLNQVINHMSHDLHIHNYAIAPQSGGTIPFHKSKMRDGRPWTPSSSTHRPTGALEIFPWMDFEEPIRVPAISLDDFCNTHRVGHIDLLKMDIQGAEIDAVLGGQATFTRTKYVLTEVVHNAEYEGQATLTELMAAMPGHWHVVEHLLCDALLENVS